MEKESIEKQFIAMVQEYRQVIWKVCYIYAKDDDNLNDLYQETVVNLWKSYPKFRNDSKLSTWVYRIALNSCISFYRKFGKKNKTVEITPFLELTDDNGLVEQIQDLYNLINNLGMLEKALILLWLEDKNYQEIAEISGLSQTNVATKLSRIKEKLRKMSES